MNPGNHGKVLQMVPKLASGFLDVHQKGTRSLQKGMALLQKGMALLQKGVVLLQKAWLYINIGYSGSCFKNMPLPRNVVFTSWLRLKF